MKFFRVLAFVALATPAMGGLVSCSSAEKFDTSTPEGAFKMGEEYEKDDRFEEAIAKFSDVKNKHPYSRFATLAELKIADIQFKRENYIEAQNAYQLFKDFHPKHPQIDYVTFRLGLSYFMQLPATIDRDLSLADKAILYFDETINSFPNSAYVAEAREKKQAALKMLAEKEMYVANFYYKRQKYDSALKRFEGLLKTYPNLGLDAEALFGAARSAYEIGEKERGSQYFKNLTSLYPDSSEARRAKNDFSRYGAD